MADRNLSKDILVALAGFIGLIYLINPTAGVLELIPDNLPFVGNLDEAAACALILAAFRYYGIDLTAFLGRGLKGGKSGRGPNDSRSD